MKSEIFISKINSKKSGKSLVTMILLLTKPIYLHVSCILPEGKVSLTPSFNI